MISAKNRLGSRLFGDSGQCQSLLILEAHGSYSHQIVAVDGFPHIIAVILQAVYVGHMNGAPVIHMRRQ